MLKIYSPFLKQSRTFAMAMSVTWLKFTVGAESRLEDQAGGGFAAIAAGGRTKKWRFPAGSGVSSKNLHKWWRCC
jgi:hypothetical protein